MQLPFFSELRSPKRWRYPPGDAQLEYYRRTAKGYDESHVAEDDEHFDSLRFIHGMILQLGAKRVLDSGCGTGRGIRYLRERLPGVEVLGNDPSADLLKVGVEQHGIPSHLLHHSDTASLPFGPESFDVVFSLGVLHHVPDPSSVVEKMAQLARQAVFISDSNYIGQGSLTSSLAKLFLTEIGVWPMVKYFQQGRKGWSYSEGDGVYYSYSAFNDLPILEKHFSKAFVIPIGHGASRARAFPKLRATTVLVGAMK